MTDTKSPLEAIEEKRAARKAAQTAPRDAQRVIDLEALDALEIELGDSNVASLDVPFTLGLPTLAAVRTPKAAELKRYQARCQGKGERSHGEPTLAAEELGAVCIVYPSDAEVRAALLVARPGLLVGLGVAAANLSTGKAIEEGKV